MGCIDNPPYQVYTWFMVKRICLECKKKFVVELTRRNYVKSYCSKHCKRRAWQLRNRPKINKTRKKEHIERRLKVLSHYSQGKLTCACCDESMYEFLCLDHIDGGGTQHRKELGTKYIYAWLIRNNYPEGYQVMCHNCNMAKGFYGQCPHKREALKSPDSITG